MRVRAAPAGQGRLRHRSRDGCATLGSPTRPLKARVLGRLPRAWSQDASAVAPVTEDLKPAMGPPVGGDGAEAGGYKDAEGALSGAAGQSVQRSRAAKPPTDLVVLGRRPWLFGSPPSNAATRGPWHDPAGLSTGASSIWEIGLVADLRSAAGPCCNPEWGRPRRPRLRRASRSATERCRARRHLLLSSSSKRCSSCPAERLQTRVTRNRKCYSPPRGNRTAESPGR